MAKPHLDALHRQLALIRFWRSDVGRRFGDGYALSLESKQQRHSGAYHDKSLPEWYADHLDQSETYWAADEMITLVEHAAATYDANEPLLPTDLPTPTGFVLMEESRSFIDRRGDRLGYRIFTWWVTKEPRRGVTGVHWIDGVEVAMYTDPNDPNDDQLRRVPPSVRTWPASLVHTSFWPFDWSIQNLVDGAEESTEGDPYFDDRAMRDAEFTMKFLKTFWRLIQQRIMTVAPHRADRATARRAIRSGFLGDTDDIKVITLRRYKEPQEDLHDSEGNVVEWSHRWLVDAHWRSQYYPSLGTHRQIYISPYVKGPEDRPLIIKDKIFKWSR